MNRNNRALSCASCSLACASAVDTRAAAKRPITETDLYKFTWIADPQISPDGATVAFVQVTVNEKDNKYESALYTRAGSRPEARRRSGSRAGRATRRRGGRPTATGWPSCGRTTRTVPQIHLLPMRGGEARALTELPKGAGGAGVVARRADDRVHEHDGAPTT